MNYNELNKKLNIVADFKKRRLLIESYSIFHKQFFYYYPAREIFLIYRVTDEFIYLISERVKVWPKNIEDAERNFFNSWFCGNGLKRCIKFKRNMYSEIKNSKVWDVF